MRVALATSVDAPTFIPAELTLLVAACARLGFDARPAVWDDREMNWAAFSGVLIRTCWDYHLKSEAFVDWLDRLDRTGIPVWNPTPLIRWNIDKRYLCTLADHGLAVVPTEWIDPARPPRLAHLLRSRQWSDVVVKPAISASAQGLWRASASTADADQPRFEAQLASGAALVQPFMSEVTQDGEWSIVFLGGTFSHAVRKNAGPDDFRVQSHLGGTATAATPPQALITDAADALRMASLITRVPLGHMLYARIDGVERKGRLVLMELECIEPQLFLTHDDHAADRLASALAAALRPVVGRAQT